MTYIIKYTHNTCLLKNNVIFLNLILGLKIILVKIFINYTYNIVPRYLLFKLKYVTII